MSVSMADVKKIRDLSNAGMMDCKNALVSANGDIDKALKILKEKGLADAKKRSDRETKEGGVYIKTKANRVTIALIGCETDFVSKNDIFIKAKDVILDKMLESGNDDIDEYNDNIQEAISQIKENIEFKKAKVVDLKDNEIASEYIHGNNKIGVVSIFEINNKEIQDNGKFKEFANNICLHIAANSPEYISENDVPDSDKEEQKSIIMKQLADSGKPAEVLENIVKGKISKHLSEVCLLKQKYVKDDKNSVEKYISSVNSELNSDIKIVNFVRYMVGT